MYQLETDDSTTKEDNSEEFVDVTQLSPVEKFINMFENCHSSAQIFSIIDENKDGMLSAVEIKEKINEILTQ